jgi:chemosensory pili system protein ChpB (putative protein-glutamate methylesterase)
LTRQQSPQPAAPAAVSQPPAPVAANVVNMPQAAGLTYTDRAERVWVLGASIGGPQAVKEFLAALPARLPVAFVLAQHISANFVDLLAEQLNRATRFKVLCPREGHEVRNQEVLVAPVDQRLMINRKRRVELHPPRRNAIYSPSIDTLMADVADSFGDAAGAIIFSGMGNDGVAGCHAIADQGGLVWAQDPESCVISTMPDNARKTGAVSLSGSPARLAERLVSYLQNERVAPVAPH